MYNTLSLLSNENRKRESSHQKRRMFGETAWQVAISCQVCKFPCSFLEFYHKQGPQLSYVIQQHEG